MLSQSVIYLRMSGDRLFLAGGGIEVYIMAGALAQQGTSLVGKPLDQVVSFHTEISLVW